MRWKNEDVPPAVRVAFGAAAAGYLAACVWTATGLPSRAATHFDASGEADGWSSPGVTSAVFLVLGVVLFVLVPWVGSIARVNLPGLCSSLNSGGASLLDR